MAMTFLAGAAISLQSYVNGRLGRDIGSADRRRGDQQRRRRWSRRSAIVLATGALPRARRPAARARAAAGLAVPRRARRRGASCSSPRSAAPEVGVALLTVALVCGSTGGSLPVDAPGLGPAGRRPITATARRGRAARDRGDGDRRASARAATCEPLLLALALGAGVGMALQAAANGQLARATGEPFVASLSTRRSGWPRSASSRLVALATVSLDALPANPLLYVGGLLGAFVVVVSATAVQTLGVLRLGLATVAGQTSGALIVDLVAPAPGEAVTAGDGRRRRAHDGRGRRSAGAPASGAGAAAPRPAGRAATLTLRGRPAARYA